MYCNALDILNILKLRYHDNHPKTTEKYDTTGLKKCFNRIQQFYNVYIHTMQKVAKMQRGPQKVGKYARLTRFYHGRTLVVQIEVSQPFYLLPKPFMEIYGLFSSMTVSSNEWQAHRNESCREAIKKCGGEHMKFYQLVT